MDSTSKISLLVLRDSTGLEVLHSINLLPERSLLEVLKELSVDIDHSCGGNGTCGTCQIQLRGPVEALSKRSEVEIEMANDRGLLHDQRLACQCQILKSVKITIP